ncbi:MerR family transcriptional regulator [Nocardioides sp.]|uniref:MerR family transcriptional regulator n=1 Tax=Nocardioides sp. TaxID=35761 RepID=UPI001A26334F|nr:MerR family transcriptional regulator [Nocardioides sp.]MBJ7357475.1 MerR family transcriptional regulator [Nocardioides sp.]
MDLTIGDVAARTGLTQRTLRYYEELGLLAPPRDTDGRRRYDAAAIDRLYRIRLLRDLGTSPSDVTPDGVDLLEVTRRHLAALDARLAELARQRERVRAVEARLLGGDRPCDEELLDLLAGLGDEPAAVRRLTLLVYRDIAAAQRHLVEVFGLEAGDLTRDGDGHVVHGEVFAGDGVIWMHRESEEHRLASPATSGTASHCMAVDVDDVDAHHARAVAAGAEVVYGPTVMPYGVREYAARDSEGGLWSFMQPMAPEEEDDG